VVRRFGAVAKTEWISARQVHWLARLAAESANGRSALDFCLHERGDADTVMDMMLGLPLGSFWARGNLSEVRYWLDEALARPGPVTVLRVRAMLCGCLLAMVGGDVTTGGRLLDDARNLVPHTSDPIVLTELHFVDAHAARYAGDLPRAVVELALALAKGATDLAGISTSCSRWPLWVVGGSARTVEGVLRGDHCAHRTARGVAAPGARTVGVGFGCVALG